MAIDRAFAPSLWDIALDARLMAIVGPRGGGSKGDGGSKEPGGCGHFPRHWRVVTTGVLATPALNLDGP